MYTHSQCGWQTNEYGPLIQYCVTDLSFGRSHEPILREHTRCSDVKGSSTRTHAHTQMYTKYTYMTRISTEQHSLESQATEQPTRTYQYMSCFLFKYNQQDATLYNILYYFQCSTCFGRFLRPSSGAQELYTQHLVCARLACCYR